MFSLAEIIFILIRCLPWEAHKCDKAIGLHVSASTILSTVSANLSVAEITFLTREQRDGEEHFAECTLDARIWKKECEWDGIESNA